MSTYIGKPTNFKSSSSDELANTLLLGNNIKPKLTSKDLNKNYISKI